MAIWLVNAGDSYEDAFEFVGEAGVTLPTLLDSEKSLYDQYNRNDAVGSGYGPFPLQILMDRDGVIRHMAVQYDAADMRSRIDELLAE